MTRATNEHERKGHEHGRARALHYDTSTDGYVHPQARAVCSWACLVGFEATKSDIQVALTPDQGKRVRYHAIVVAAPTTSVPPRLVMIMDGAPEGIGEAQQRVHGHIMDCRGWGRYRGAIYQGREGRKLVVVQAYFPDSECVKTKKRCGNNSFELGGMAEKAPKGSSRSSWKPGPVPPKPALSLVRHPKRLLMDDLTMHPARYADDRHCTLVVM